MTETDQTPPPPWPDQLGKGETRNRLTAMKVSELQTIADYEGIKVGPRKEDTVNRIMGVWFDKARPDFPPPSAPVVSPASGVTRTPLGHVIYPTGEPLTGLFDRRAVKQQLKSMTTAALQAIADQEGIKADSKGAVLDRYDMVPLILDVWQGRALESLAGGIPDKPSMQGSRTLGNSPAPEPAEVAPAWPDQLGQHETLRRLNSMRASELNAIAISEGVKVGPKKTDTSERIIAHWREHGMTQPFPGPAESRTGESARVTRIKKSSQR